MSDSIKSYLEDNPDAELPNATVPSQSKPKYRWKCAHCGTVVKEVKDSGCKQCGGKEYKWVKIHAEAT